MMRTHRLRTACCAFARATRASAAIEFALGAVALLGVAALCFDLYSRVEADTTGARIAATMADFVSRGPGSSEDTLDGSAMKALGTFLHTHELHVPADLVFVVTALRQGTGTPPPAVEVLWSDDAMRFGDDEVTEALARTCSRFVTDSAGQQTLQLPDGITASEFTMAAGEVVVVVEVCARLSGAGMLTQHFISGDLYRHHVLPVRDPERFPDTEPVHASRRGGDNALARAVLHRAGSEV